MSGRHSRGRVKIVAGSTQVLCADGVMLVTEINNLGAQLRSAAGETLTVGWSELETLQEFTDGTAQAVHGSLMPRWEALSESAQTEALDRLEVVLEITTGYRHGFTALRREGEPRALVNPDRSLTRRCEAMARQMTLENEADRSRGRRVAAGELRDKPVGKTTLLKWVRDYEREGVWGLVDKRATRETAGFDSFDARFVALAHAEVDRFDGDVSTVRINEVHRRIMVEAKAQGLDLDVPQRRAQSFLSWLMAGRGRGTRAQRSRSMRGTSGYRHFPALRPGQVVAIDVTRADVMVWDDLHDKSYSVEVITALDVATRCVLALRVVPKSANSTDASLLIYDVMRPFAMQVSGTTATDWRWAGIPEAIEFDCDHVRAAADRVEQDAADAEADMPSLEWSTLQGIHRIPGLVPETIRSDHGSIFTSEHFPHLLNDLGIELSLSRGSRPTDNAHVERWHETLQAAVQQIAGFKGRSPFERGRRVGRDRTDRDRPLITARELERQLRLWVALDYHRSWHEGIVLPNAPEARLTPLEMFDAYLQITGRIDLPQHPGLMYQFLPVQWFTIGQAGVEIKNLTYDSEILDDFRNCAPGAFRAADRKVPFHYDPRDVTRIWFTHPDTQVVHEVPWRGAWRVHAPLTDKIQDVVCQQVKRRGGNRALGKRAAEREIIRQLGQLADVGSHAGDEALWAAAALRFEASRKDHLEAQLAAYSAARTAGEVSDPNLDRTRPPTLDTTAAEGGARSATPRSATGDNAHVVALWSRLQARDAGLDHAQDR